MQHSSRSGDHKPIQERTAGGNRASTPSFGPDLQAQIGDQLRALHHDLLNEKVPDRFVQLLERLASQDAKDS